MDAADIILKREIKIGILSGRQYDGRISARQRIGITFKVQIEIKFECQTEFAVVEMLDRISGGF